MAGFIQTLFSLSVSGTFLAVILLLLKPLYKNRFSHKWQYYIWLVVIARLLFPFTIKTGFNIMESIYGQVYSMFAQIKAENNTDRPEYSVEESGKPSQPAASNTDKINTRPGNASTENNAPEDLHLVKKMAKNLLLFARQNIFYIWLVTAIALFTRKITAYQGFTRYLKAGRAEAGSLELWEEMGSLIEKSNIKVNVNLYTNSLISSPLLTGFFRPYIIIPSEEIDMTDFKNIIHHELIHFRRKDMFYKWLVQLTVCIHWFNPFVYWIAHETGRLCELSCDEMVIKNLDGQGKKEYGNTLLNMAVTGKTFKSSIASVTLNESKKLLKERLDKIMEFKKKTIISSLLSVALAFALCATAATASMDWQPASTTNIAGNTKTDILKTRNNNDTSTIDKAIKNGRIILEDGSYHILCDGVTKKDMSSGGVTDGCIGIILEQTDGGYISIGPIEPERDLDGLVEYVEDICQNHIKDKTMTKKEAELLTGFAIKLVEGNGKIRGIKDSSSIYKEYKKWQIKRKNGNYYYKDQRVRVFIDLKPDKSFMEFSYNKKGNIDLKITRNKNGKITKVKQISKKEADKFLDN